MFVYDPVELKKDYHLSLNEMKNTDISMTYKISQQTFCFCNKAELLTSMKRMRNLYKQNLITVDGNNNLMKTIDGVEWYIFVLNGIENDGSINGNIDPAGLIFDNEVFCVCGTIFMLKYKSHRDTMYNFITTGKNNPL